MNIAEHILKLKDYTGEDEVIPSKEYAELVGNEQAPNKFYSNILPLDKAIDGFEGGEVIVISGPRKSGKTLLAQSFTISFSEQEIYSLWFSFELTPRQFLNRFQPELPAFVLPKKLKAYSLDWLRDRILEAIAKYGISVVFIDHLHFLFDIARVKNTSVEIGQIIRYLKSLAIELNIVIFIMCHTHKINPLAEDLNDEVIRDSSFVSQESDCGLLIWRIKNTDNKSCLKVCYHRRTGTWEKVIRLIKVRGRLHEIRD